MKIEIHDRMNHQCRQCGENSSNKRKFIIRCLCGWLKLAIHNAEERTPARTYMQDYKYREQTCANEPVFTK